MKTLKDLNRKLEKARSIVKALNTSKKQLIRRETVGRHARAQKKAKYRIGDILEYSDGYPPILVTYIGCYESGEPWYGGLQIVNGKLTRNRRRTEGWGQQDTTKDRDGRKYPSSWKKVGDCSMLLFQNAPADLPRTGDAEQPKALPIKAQRE